MHKKLNCLVVDDEPLAREGISEYVNEIDFLHLSGSCKNAVETIEILNNLSIDLILLDIQMPGLSGVELLKSINNPPLVIFTTANRDFALESYELPNVIDYLLKPISFERFFKAVNKAYGKFSFEKESTSEKEYFFIKTDNKFIKIRLSDILYIESLKDYIFIYAKTESKLIKKYMTLVSLKNVEERLPSDKFLRVHRSFIVAIDKIDSFEGNIIKILEKAIPVSKGFRDEVFEKVIGDNLWKR